MADIILRTLYQQLFTYIRGMWRHRWYFAVISWLVCLGGWTFVYLMPDEYAATGQVLIENPQGVIAPYLRQVTGPQTDVSHEARKVLNQLLNRSNLLQVIRSTPLAEQLDSPQQLEEELYNIRSQLSIQPAGRSSGVWNISLRHPNPQVPHLIIRGLLDILMQETIDPSSSNQARTAQRFLDMQIKEYETKLAEAEAALREYKRRNAHLLPGEGGGYYVRLKNLTNRLDQEQGKLRELEQRRQELQRKLQELTQPEGANPVDVINQRIADLEQQLSQMRAKYYLKGGQQMPLYPADHPDVVTIRRTIDTLQQQRQETLKQMAEAKEAPTLPEWEQDPVYRQLMIQLNETDVDIATLRGRVQATGKQLTELHALENTLPTVEAELLRYERRFNFTREKLLALLAQQGEASFSGDVVESLARQLRFKILSVPQPPRRPVGPNRPLFLTVVLLGGMLAGITMALFLAVIRPVFDSPLTLKRELGLPVLGTISMVREPDGFTVFSIPIVFYVVVGGLFVAYFVVLYPHLG